jgi:hypothetical protein
VPLHQLAKQLGYQFKIGDDGTLDGDRSLGVTKLESLFGA